jgi:hypothetical protein
MTTTDTTNKPFMIEKWRVYEAYKAVKSNNGAAGVDGQTIEQFEADLKGNFSRRSCFQDQSQSTRIIVNQHARCTNARSF